MNFEENFLFRRTRKINEKTSISYRLADNLIAFGEADISIFSIIISEITNNEITDEIILPSVCNDRHTAMRIFDMLFCGCVLPCLASEIIEEIYQSIL